MGPIIVGMILGLVVTFALLSAIDATLNIFTPYDVGVTETTIILVFGCLLGIFVGYKLS